MRGRTESISDIRAMARGLVRTDIAEDTKGLVYQVLNMQYVLECLLEDTDEVAIQRTREPTSDREREQLKEMDRLLRGRFGDRLKGC